jgi:ketosteroid isomerase-like protein
MMWNGKSPACSIRGARRRSKREIGNEAFVGHPEIVVTRMIEEADVVVAEGSVRRHKRVGAELRLRFCDVFVMEAGKIKQLTSYLTDFG